MYVHGSQQKPCHELFHEWCEIWLVTTPRASGLLMHMSSGELMWTFPMTKSELMISANFSSPKGPNHSQLWSDFASSLAGLMMICAQISREDIDSIDFSHWHWSMEKWVLKMVDVINNVYLGHRDADIVVLLISA